MCLAKKRACTRQQYMLARQHFSVEGVYLIRVGTNAETGKEYLKAQSAYLQPVILSALKGVPHLSVYFVVLAENIV